MGGPTSSWGLRNRITRLNLNDHDHDDDGDDDDDNNNNYLLTYSMEQSPSWEADQFSQLTKKFPAFYGTRRFFTLLTSARHLSLSWANSIQSPQPPPTSPTSILILSSHLRLGLPNGIIIIIVPFFDYVLRLSNIYSPVFISTVRSESRCALRLGT
jgi:hypothetical protein